jgi:hypothetical protein
MAVWARALARLLCFCAASFLSCFAASISSFDPVIGSVGDQVTIHGGGFSAAPSVVVTYTNGKIDHSAAATADDIILSIVPTGATTGPISVKVGSGTTVFSGMDYTVVGPGPYITNFNPVVGSAGSACTIRGLHFFSGFVTNVYFNGKPASFFLASDNEVQATAPAGVTTGPISVHGTNGNNTTISNFFVPPVITGFSPFNGRAGTNVTVTGTNFTGASSVSIGGVSASTFTVLSNNALTVTVPVGALTGIVRVIAPAGSYQTTSNFVVQPTITGFSPAFGPAGTSVNITGANLAGVTSVKFSGVPASSFSGASFGQVTAVVPPTAVSGPIAVTTPDGSAQSAANFYLPPQISTFSPTKGGAGALVTVTGANLTNTSAISFNGTSAPTFYVTNNTSVGVIVPAGFSTGPITITTPGGTATSSGTFYGVPGIVSFNPTHGLPGTNVTITGTNLMGVTSVQFNGVAASFTATVNNTTLTATVPSAAQTGPIRITSPGGTNITAQNFVLDYNADLSVSLSRFPDPVFIGSNLVYTITVINSGPFDANNVRVTNYLPASVSIRSYNLSQGTVLNAGNPFSANFGTITVNGQAVLVLTVAPQSTGSISNYVTVSSDLSDFVTANNSTSVLTFVLPLPRLSISVLPAQKLQLSWPVELTNFVLQFNNAFPTNAYWSNHLTVPSILGNQRQVVDTNSSQTRFYRLKD